MKTKNIVALALLVVTAISANAQVVTGVNDLVFGFRQSTGSSSLEINLGNINQFTGAAAQGIGNATLNLGNFSSLLTSTYGAGWASDSTIQWSAAGTAGTGAAATNGQAVRTAWMTDHWNAAAGTLGVQNSTSFSNGFGTALAGTADGKIINVYNGMTLATAGQTTGSAVVLPSGGNSWVTQQGVSTAAWGAFFTNATVNNQPTNLNGSSSYSASDLYSLTPTGAGTSTNAFFGTFALWSNGDITFTGAAIPEPSTYAAIIGVAMLGFGAIRRRMQRAQAQA